MPSVSQPNRSARSSGGILKSEIVVVYLDRREICILEQISSAERGESSLRNDQVYLGRSQLRGNIRNVNISRTCVANDISFSLPANWSWPEILISENEQSLN